jgi:RpiR family carbohydrate utilization transcriptional regulator
MKKAPARVSAPAINLPERIDQLSAKRQELIRPILEHPREYVLLSVRAMAKRLRTDPATIVRVVRGLGFASYREFQHHLHELSLAFATSLDTMQPADRDSDMPSFVRDALGQDLKNLQGLRNSLDAQRLAALAKRFYEARRIVILASDLAALLAEYLEYQISLLGLPIFSARSRAASCISRARSVRRIWLSV